MSLGQLARCMNVNYSRRDLCAAGLAPAISRYDERLAVRRTAAKKVRGDPSEHVEQQRQKRVYFQTDQVEDL